MQMREKVGKSRYAVFFQKFKAPEDRQVGRQSGAYGAIWPNKR